MTRSVRQKLLDAWWRQGQHCIWCGEWCYVAGWQDKDWLRRRLGIVPEQRGSAKALRARRATAEHLLPRSLGGTDAAVNIVAACRRCNGRRGNDPHALTPDPAVLARMPDDLRRRVAKIAALAQERKPA